MEGRVENDPVRIAAVCAETAYDVDAVCDELEKMKEIMLSPINIDCFGDTCREADCMACILNRAIEIVRNGGKNE